MSYKIDFDTASSDHIEQALCERLEQIRLAHNITQKDLAREAGISSRTVSRMANGEGISLDTFIRIVKALHIQQNLTALLPDPSVRPIERIARQGHQRQRARPKPDRGSASSWSWEDEDKTDD